MYLHSGEELSNCVEVAQDVHVHLNYFYEQNEGGYIVVVVVFFVVFFFFGGGGQAVTILSQLE